MNPMRGSDDQKLDALFQAYREACQAPEASANFMPNLWARIESRQSFTLVFQRMANALATAAVALSLMIGAYMAIPRSGPQLGQTYVEVLAEADTPDNIAPTTVDYENN
ncbi:MAG TPA: hypothetical protein VKE70_23370 [Candidatus Solibacter sp.]|nr:hypothetical protein [Candidatus Solibacter sp.]